jgi:hypothetical protein
LLASAIVGGRLSPTLGWWCMLAALLRSTLGCSPRARLVLKQELHHETPNQYRGLTAL